MDPNLTLLGIAILNAFTAFMSWRTHALTKQVEIASNSMKDALVKATGEASHAAGLAEGKASGERKAATLAEGVLQGTEVKQRKEQL